MIYKVNRHIMKTTEAIYVIINYFEVTVKYLSLSLSLCLSLSFVLIMLLINKHLSIINNNYNC